MTQKDWNTGPGFEFTAKPTSDHRIMRSNVKPDMVFSSDQGPIVTIKPDGRIELDPGVSLDQAAKVFWDAVALHGVGISAELESAKRKIAELEEKLSVGVALGGGLMAYGSLDACSKIQDYILIDSQHPVEKNDMCRAWAKRMQLAEARIDNAPKGFVDFIVGHVAYIKFDVDDELTAQQLALIPQGTKVRLVLVPV